LQEDRNAQVDDNANAEDVQAPAPNNRFLDVLDFYARPGAPIAIIDIARNELDAYKALPELPIATVNGIVNPLDWWKENSQVYPNLAKLAKKYLCIPATSAPSERVFSKAGLTIANKRAAMNGDLAANLIFLEANWNAI